MTVTRRLPRPDKVSLEATFEGLWLLIGQFRERVLIEPSH